MRLIGLTGGIGTGKTTVSNYLNKTHHLPIWDADIYARKAVQPNSLILDNIVENYGTDILLANGNLNRQKLGEIVFNNQEELLWLEKQIHPYVRDRFEQNIQQFVIKNNEPGYHSSDRYPTAVLVVPLLFEAKMTDLVTEIWVTYTSPQQQIERLMKRDGLSQEQAYTRINHQMPLENKCQQADVVLDNSSTLEILLKQVDSAIAHP
ncbi:MAG: dephospho-CoA kinase [Okeania sp. SIO2C9]|uniref:dephospho-CoA kinase n=1 Tax=Okeania sp. SIO2C9 TaxID=2607791 RepID=UPI0013C26944|nr:dephospho-CoA kinase [Okeania sp. SIO2C9]NEQ72939.1 dephospho-CoA kinase [Okeania sp. SIO2C9]